MSPEIVLGLRVKPLTGDYSHSSWLKSVFGFKSDYKKNLHEDSFWILRRYKEKFSIELREFHWIEIGLFRHHPHLGGKKEAQSRFIVTLRIQYRTLQNLSWTISVGHLHPGGWLLLMGCRWLGMQVASFGRMTGFSERGSWSGGLMRLVLVKWLFVGSLLGSLEKINATESGEKIRKRKVKNRTGYTLIVSESDLHLDIRI